MNREIKFRVWNGEQMVSPDYIDRNGCGHWMENSIHTMSQNLLQFIGLKDQHGRDIYEGDILTCDGYKVVIEFHGGQFVGINTDKDSPIRETQNRNWFSWEVIGNIYENPELLQS